MNIYGQITELTGHTPLLRLGNIISQFSLECDICAKLEYFNPAGSIKDRVAANMILEAEKSGRLTKGATIIEPTSGNTGIGLACIAAARGYKVILTMPDTMSVERRNLLSAYGAQIILTDGALGMSGAIKKAEALAQEIPNSFLAGQFENPDNPEAHYKSTGPEIWEDTDGNIDILVAGIGTGGTITGTGKFLKEKSPTLKVVGFEPSLSPFLTEGKSGAHGLQGIGAGFKPQVLDEKIYDEIITVSNEDAYDMGRMLAQKEGILVGITSGAAVFTAVTLAKRPENRGKRIVAILPDTGERYLSTPMFK